MSWLRFDYVSASISRKCVGRETLQLLSSFYVPELVEECVATALAECFDNHV